MAHFEDLRHGVNALRCTFEILANQQNITSEELIAIQVELVKINGKYGTDWKGDWLGKLAFDYSFCVEMQTVLEEREELSYKRRARLYRMVTKNPDVQAVWDQLPDLSPNLFLDRSERELLSVRKNRRYK